MLKEKKRKKYGRKERTKQWTGPPAQPWPAQLCPALPCPALPCPTSPKYLASDYKTFSVCPSFKLVATIKYFRSILKVGHSKGGFTQPILTCIFFVAFQKTHQCSIFDSTMVTAKRAKTHSSIGRVNRPLVWVDMTCSFCWNLKVENCQVLSSQPTKDF